MTKIAFIADTHVSNHRQHGGQVSGGLNDRARICVATLRDAARAAGSANADFAVALGDLFDTTKPPPPLIRAVADALEQFPGGVRVIVGNHDRSSDAENDHAASPLGLSHEIQVYEQPAVLGSGPTMLYVPFMPGPAKDWLPDVMREHAGHLVDDPKTSPRILCLHLGIWDDQTPAFLRDVSDSVSLSLVTDLMALYDIDAVVAGNWHKRRTWQVDVRGTRRFVAVVGTTCPVNFGDEGCDGKMLVLDADVEDGRSYIRPEWVDVAGPRWHTFDAAGLANADLGKLRGRGCMPFIRACVPTADYADALEHRTYLESNGVRVVVTVDASAAKAMAREAAAAARQEESFDRASDAYVAGIDVPDPGTLDGVRAKLAAYRRRAA